MRKTLPVFVLLLMCNLASAQLIIGHRGASADAPENTLPSFQLAFEQKADGIETDIYLTKDGQIICLHDKDTLRTTGVKLVPAEATLAELRALDAGKWKDPKFAGTKIPTLEEVLAIVPPGKRFYIEIKTGPEIVPALKQSLARCSLAPEQTIIISFKDDAIAACRREMPHLKAHLIVSFKQDKKTNTWSPTLEQILARLDKTHASGLDVQGNLTFVNQPFVAALRQRGYEFHTWTIDKPEDARALQKLGVDSITTNKPAFLRSVLFPG